VILGTPDPLPENELTALGKLHENFAQRVSAKFAAYLKSSFRVTVAGEVVQVLRDAWVAEIALPSCFLLLKLQPQQAIGVLQLDHSITFASLELLLGGRAQEPPEAARGFTALELKLLRPMFETLVDELKAVWRNKAQVSISLESAATDAERMKVLVSQGPLLTGRFDVSISGVQGSMTLAIPRHAIRSLCQEADSLQPVASISSAEQRAKTVRALQSTPVRLGAELRAASLSLRDVLALEVDDVIVGLASAQHPVTVSINGVSKYRAHVTRRDGERALVISDEIHSGT
jgi:flagellar motor switch protein FliM